MRKERRWLTSVTKEAARAKIEMPWARGANRAKHIANRRAMAAELKSAAVPSQSIRS